MEHSRMMKLCCVTPTSRCLHVYVCAGFYLRLYVPVMFLTSSVASLDRSDDVACD